MTVVCMSITERTLSILCKNNKKEKKQMEEYKNIMKLVDDKLAEQESTIEYYRKEKEKWEERENELRLNVLHLEAENARLAELKESLGRKMYDTY